MERLFIGTDIGTTSTKSIAYNRAGEIIYEAKRGYPLLTPSEEIAEQDPEEIFQAVLYTWSELLAKISDPMRIEFISFSSAMHSLIGVDENGAALTASLTWADTRSDFFVNQYKEANKTAEVYGKTGVPLHAMLPFFKILWLKEHQRECFYKIRKFISIKEYVFKQLFGVYVVDESIAASSGVFNIHQLDWDEGLISELGISREQLSEVVKTTYSDLQLTEEYQNKLGFHRDIKFIIGSSDGVLANLGVGAVKAGSVAVSIGTSGAVRTMSESIEQDEHAGTFCYPLIEGHWIIGGPVNNGGVILEWAKNQLLKTNQLSTEISLADLTEVAKTAEPGANGIVFLPYLLGERAPIWQANAKGMFFGLSIHHKNADIIRSIMEGMLFNLREVKESLFQQKDAAKIVYASGGFAKSAMLRQMMADIFNIQISIPTDYESSCFGAVLLGFYATGEVTSFSELAPFYDPKRSYSPSITASSIYQDTYDKYLKIKTIVQGESFFTN